MPSRKNLDKLLKFGFTINDIFGPLNLDDLMSMTKGQRVKTLRMRMGLLSKDAANALEMSPQHLSLVELDKLDISRDVATRMADFFNLPMSVFYTQRTRKGRKKCETPSSTL